MGFKIPFLSSIRGRGFSKWEREGTVSLRNHSYVSNAEVALPKPFASNECPKCGKAGVVKYRCSPALLCTHSAGHHVECSKCGVFVQPE